MCGADRYFLGSHMAIKNCLAELLPTPNSAKLRTFLTPLLVLALGGGGLGAAMAFGPYVAMTVPLAAVLFASALRDYRVAVCVVVFMLPIAPTHLIPHDVVGVSGANLMHALVLLAGSAIILSYSVHRPRFALPLWPKTFWLYFAVFVAAAVHGAVSSGDIPDYFVVLNVVSSTDVKTYFQDILVNPSVALGAAAVVSVAVRNARRPSLYLVPLFCSATVFACVVLVVAATSGSSLNDLAQQDSREFLSGTGLHANEIGLLLNTAWALALFTFIHVNRLSLRLTLAGVSALVAVGIALTFSRGAYLGFLTSIAYLLLVKRKFFLILCAAIVIPLSALVLPESITHRATHQVYSNDVDALSSGRIDEIWKPLLPEVIKSPLIGSGVGSILWSDAARQHKILPVGHPHSAYLGALLYLGLIGMSVVLIFFAHMWRLFTRLSVNAPQPLWRGFFNGAAACVLVLLVQGATDDSFLPGRTQSFLWLAYGAAIGFQSRLNAIGRAAIARPAVRPPFRV